jgi:hypothetical protein
MDAVITYVNGLEPKWRYKCVQCDMFPNFIQRFYDYGTLRFLLRGISEHMKFIDRVFLVVSNIEQVPDYVNDNVIIITHDMFIPEECLPTFNSNTIECFLWNIPGLSEEFIYFNDDIIPIKKMEREEFFKDGLVCIDYQTRASGVRYFNEIVKTCNFLASKYYNENTCIDTLRPPHIMTPFFRSDYYKNYELIKNEEEYLPRTLRGENQISQYYFANCYYYQNKYNAYSPQHIYLHTNHTSDEFITKINEHKDEQIICINSYGCFLDKTLKETIVLIEKELYNILPNKGIYER